MGNPLSLLPLSLLPCSLVRCWTPRVELASCVLHDITSLLRLLFGIGRLKLLSRLLTLPFSLRASKLMSFVGGSRCLLSRSSSTPISRAPDSLTIITTAKVHRWCGMMMSSIVEVGSGGAFFPRTRGCFRSSLADAELKLPMDDD